MIPRGLFFTITVGVAAVLVWLMESRLIHAPTFSPSYSTDLRSAELTERGPDLGPQESITAFSSWIVEWMSASASDKLDKEKVGLRIAASRRAVMTNLIQHEPEKALEYAISDAVKSKLPPSIQVHIESSIDTVGDILTTANCTKAQCSVRRSVFANGANYTAFGYGENVNWSGKSVQIRGVALDGLLALADDPNRPPTSAAPAASWVLGEKRVLVVKVDFTDVSGPPAGSDDEISDTMRTANSYYQDVSNGRCSFSFTLFPGLLRAPKPQSQYSTHADLLGPDIMKLARDFDALHGGTGLYDMERYDRWVIYSKNLIIGAGGGEAALGAAGIWMRNTFDSDILIHELGHNHGLDHSYLWAVGLGETPISPKGRTITYGDRFDVMGGVSLANERPLTAHFNVVQKESLGYLSTESIATVKASGRYRLYRHDHRSASGVRSLAIFGTGYDYRVEHRRMPPFRGFEHLSRLTNGVIIHWGNAPSGRGRGHLLDMNPGSGEDPNDVISDTYDAPLALGETFTDPALGMNITPIAIGGTSPNEFIDVQIAFNKSATTPLPSLTVTRPTGPFLARADYEFRATPSERGGAELGLYWSFADMVVHPQGENAKQRWLIGGDYSVKVRARDSESATVVHEFPVKVVDPLIEWTKRLKAPIGAGGFSDVIFAGGKFLAVGACGTFLSTDGAAWVQASVLSAAGVAYGNGRYVIIAGNRILFSEDGSVWKQADVQTGVSRLELIAYGNGRFVAIDGEGRVAISTRGDIWTEGGNTGTARFLYRLRFENGLFVAVGDKGSIFTSRDGGDWKDRSVVSPSFSNVLFQDAIYYKGRWLVTDINEVWASSDGDTWGQLISRHSNKFVKLAIARGVLVGFGNPLLLSDAGLRASKLQTAEDLSQWSPGRTVGEIDETFTAMAEGNGSIVMVGYLQRPRASVAEPASGIIYQSGRSFPPIISTQPISQSWSGAATLALSVDSTSDSPVRYQWSRDDVAIPGATNASLAITNPGNYFVTVSNDSGETKSDTAVISDAARVPTNWLSNLSIRTNLQRGESLSVGFAVTGGTKMVVARVAGPALNAFGIRGMSDPRLAIYKEDKWIMANEDWDPSLGTLFKQLGAFSFLAGSKDAALSLSASGTQSAVITGSDSGQVLTELYDAGPRSGARLSNLSARGRVGSGPDVIVMGLHIAGSGRKSVLIRGIGPKLSDFGVSDVLSSPKIEIYDSANVKVAENDAWNPALSRLFTSVGAFQLNAGSKDAALSVSLEAGNTYSVQLSGRNGDVGNGLIEIYELPVDFSATEINYTIGNGNTVVSDTSLTFTSNDSLRDVRLFLSDSIAGFASFESSTGSVQSNSMVIPAIQRNTPYSIKLRWSLPKAALPGLYRGALQIAAGAETLSQTLPINIIVDYGVNVVAPNVVVPSASTVAKIVSMASDRSQVIFSQNSPEVASLQVGQVLVVPDSQQSPGGFIGRVQGVSDSALGLVVQCAPASLTNAFRDANISLSRTLGPADMAVETRAAIASVATVGPERHASSLDGEIHIPLNDYSIYDSAGGKVTLDGSLIISPSFVINCEISDFQLRRLSFLNTTTVSAALELRASVDASANKSFQIGPPIKFSPITVFVGYVPIVISPQLVITAGGDGSVHVGLYTSATQSASAIIGMDYDGATWQPVASATRSFSFEPPSATADLNAKAYFAGELELLINGLVGPYAKVMPYMELSVSYFSRPQYQLYGGLEGAIGMRLKVFDFVLADKEFPSRSLYRQLIKEGDFAASFAGEYYCTITGPSSVTYVSDDPAAVASVTTSRFPGPYLVPVMLRQEGSQIKWMMLGEATNIETAPWEFSAKLDSLGDFASITGNWSHNFGPAGSPPLYSYFDISYQTQLIGSRITSTGFELDVIETASGVMAYPDLKGTFHTIKTTQAFKLKFDRRMPRGEG